MSLLSKAAKALKRVGKVAIKAASPVLASTGVGGAILGGTALGKIGGTALGTALRKTTNSATTGIVRALPGVGTAVVGGAVGGALEQHMAAACYHRKRRRRKGISGRDLSSFKRVARLIDKFAAPVHKLRKSSFKSHH